MMASLSYAEEQFWKYSPRADTCNESTPLGRPSAVMTKTGAPLEPGRAWHRMFEIPLCRLDTR